MVTHNDPNYAPFLMQFKPNVAKAKSLDVVDFYMQHLLHCALFLAIKTMRKGFCIFGHKITQNLNFNVFFFCQFLHGKKFVYCWVAQIVDILGVIKMGTFFKRNSNYMVYGNCTIAHMKIIYFAQN